MMDPITGTATEGGRSGRGGYGGDAVIEHVRVRQRHGRPHAGVGLNMTPMIDIVFQLLIYFLVATDFRLGEEVYRMDLPQRGAAAALRDPFELDETPLRIAVTSTPDPHHPYVLRIEGPYPQPGTFRELMDFLRVRQINPSTSGGLFEPEHPIIIEPSRGTSWQHAVEAFNAAARARYTNITLARAR
jgi:biopolymer transport protein ExbD